jgi:hypothetical protein
MRRRLSCFNRPLSCRRHQPVVRGLRHGLAEKHVAPARSARPSPLAGFCLIEVNEPDKCKRSRSGTVPGDPRRREGSVGFSHRRTIEAAARPLEQPAPLTLRGGATRISERAGRTGLQQGNRPCDHPQKRAGPSHGSKGDRDRDRNRQTEEPKNVGTHLRCPLYGDPAE